MKVVLVEPEEDKAVKDLAKGLIEVKEELGLEEVRAQPGIVEVLTDDPVGAHLKMARFPGVHRVGVFEKLSHKRLEEGLIKVARRVLRKDMTFELSVRVVGRADPTELYYNLMDRLIDSVEAKPEEYMPDRVLRVVYSDRASYVEYFGLTGPGGLPIGSRGDALIAFSGGFKSYTASIRVCRAGFRPHLLFVHHPEAPKNYVRRAFYKAWTLVRGLPMKSISLFVARPSKEELKELGFFGVLVSAIEKVGKGTGIKYVVFGNRDEIGLLAKELCGSLTPIFPNLGASKRDMEMMLFGEEDEHKLDWSKWKPKDIEFRGKGEVEVVKVDIGRGPIDWHLALDRYSNKAL